MRIVFFGTPQFAVPSLERLTVHSDFDVVAVVTQPDKRRGRGGGVTPSPVKKIAQEILSDSPCPIWQPIKIKQDETALQNLRDTQADAFVVVAYGQILSPEILDMPRLGCINAHGSILPAYRGAAPIQWSIHQGESETGVTTMLMDPGMDTGPMLLKTTISIGLLDTAWEVAEQLADISADLLIDTLQKLNQQAINPIPQDDACATYAPLIKKPDYVLDWSHSAIALHNQIRGFYPNCATQFRGSALKISATLPLGPDYGSQLPSDLQAVEADWKAFIAQENPSTSQPGEIVHLLKGHGPVIQTGDGHLLLRQVQPAGKRSQSAWDFANGSRLESGERLGI
ncbi:MAG: methionyl-tRNA formyltransferase [Leptolyngbyaceae cyanobacterium MO_188.B28]|nr:methionyl-tRNA formyltransferase [Leptolyngbyaceae cyanobacterium MO_188.B28]